MDKLEKKLLDSLKETEESLRRQDATEEELQRRKKELAEYYASVGRVLEIPCTDTDTMKFPRTPEYALALEKRKELIAKLVDESIVQIQMRPGLRDMPVSREDFIATLNGVEIPFGYDEPLFHIDFDKAAYKAELAKIKREFRLNYERDRGQKQPEINQILLRSVVLNRNVTHDPKKKCSTKDYFVILNQRVFGHGYSSQNEFDDLVTSNGELAYFMHQLDWAGNHYSLLFRRDILDWAKKGSKHQTIMPILTVSGADESQIKRLILQRERKEVKSIGFADYGMDR